MENKNKDQLGAGSGLACADLLAVAQWLVGDSQGKSSKYLLATAIAGEIPFTKQGYSWPHDAYDLGRCLRLIESAPSVASALPILSARAWRWRVLVEDWDGLTRLYQETDDDSRYRVVTDAMNLRFRSANVKGDMRR